MFGESERKRLNSSIEEKKNENIYEPVCALTTKSSSQKCQEQGFNLELNAAFKCIIKLLFFMLLSCFPAHERRCLSASHKCRGYYFSKGMAAAKYYFMFTAIYCFNLNAHR